MTTTKKDIERLNASMMPVLKLIYNPAFKISDRPEVKSVADAHQLFKEAWDMDSIELIEEFKVVFLNSVSRVLGIVHLSRGGINATVADLRIILRYALITGATGILLAHNHPSGGLNPSQNDIKLTEQVKTLGKVHQIRLVDHLILTRESYLSMADEGLVI